MTLEEIKDLPDERLNVRLAKELGWTELRTEDGWSESTVKSHMAKPDEDAIASPPRFCSDLNETAKVERDCADNRMDADQWEQYGKLLTNLTDTATCHDPITGGIDFHDVATVATIGPRQRTIALILTLTK